MSIEAKRYGPDCTPEERELLRSRISVYDDRIILWHEVPLMTRFQLDLFWQKHQEITRDWDSYCHLVDLTEAEIPGATERAYLKKIISTDTRLQHAAIVTGRNKLITYALKFLLSGFFIRSYSVHETKEQAIEAIRRVQNQR